MELVGKQNIASAMNILGTVGTPYMFLIDFSGERGIVEELSGLKSSPISLTIHGKMFGAIPPQSIGKSILSPSPISKERYGKGFSNIINSILHGDSYLLNYTCKTNIGKEINLPDIYCSANAPYKLLWDKKFLFFSPEPFIKIKNGKIFSYPMKGTIDANLPNAEKLLLNNEKELFEHYTIVDLIRNDLSIVATNINVDKFRYIERLETSKGALLQSSSEISGTLPRNWESIFGDIISQLLPAGSISGAPKEKTVEIIKREEFSPRGYYTGVMGIFDGNSVDSCVIIRYIEKDGDEYFFRSGGGITALSNLDEEYNELISKIYVPII